MADDADLNGQNGDRDAQGRFRKGGPGGPGNPTLRRLGEFQQAIKAAFSGEDLIAVLQALRDKAIEGDAGAGKVFLERILGRPTQEPAIAQFTLEFPELKDSHNVIEAGSRLLRAVSDGEIDVSTATQVSNLLEHARRAIEQVELEKRVEELESKLKPEARAAAL